MSTEGYLEMGYPAIHRAGDPLGPALDNETAWKMSLNDRRSKCDPNASFVRENPEGKTKHLKSRIMDIPWQALHQIGEAFLEGEPVYGRENWKTGGKEYLDDRTSHAIEHLQKWANGDRSENHLAKVAWFCCIAIWHTNRSKAEDLEGDD